MKKVLIIALLAIGSTINASAQNTSAAINPSVIASLPPSFPAGSTQGVGYMMICPVSIDKNGALQVNAVGGLPVILKKLDGTYEQGVALLSGNPPSNWLTFAHPSYGRWIRQADGSQWFIYHTAYPVPVGYERVWSHPLRGTMADPSQPQHWRMEFTALL